MTHVRPGNCYLGLTYSESRLEGFSTGMAFPETLSSTKIAVDAILVLRRFCYRRKRFNSVLGQLINSSRTILIIIEGFKSVSQMHL